MTTTTHAPTSTPVVEAFLTQVAHLTLEQAADLDNWLEVAEVPGYEDALHSAYDLLDPSDDNPEDADLHSARERELDALVDRIQIPVWAGSRRKIAYLRDRAEDIARDTLLALYLEPLLTAAQFDALTDAWQHVIDLAGVPRPLCCADHA